MEKDFKKKIYILTGLCLFFLALIVLLSKGVQKRQVMRQKAAGGPVNLSLSPGEGNIDQTGTTISIQMTNTSSSTKYIRGAEVVLELDANAVSRFEVSSAACSSTFPNNAQPPVASGNRVALACYSGAGSNPVSLGSATLGTFVLKARSGATAGNGNISFTSANIPESGTYVNLYGSGTPGVYSIPGAATPTGGQPTRPGEVTPTPTLPAECSVGVWDSVNCRRCLDNRRWGEICSDYGRFGPTPPTDPGASLATWCSCFRRCNLTATPPPACPPLTPIPTATPTLPRVGCGTICEIPAPGETDLCSLARPTPFVCRKVGDFFLCRNPACPTDNDCVCGTSPTPTQTLTPTPTATRIPTQTPTITPTPTLTCRGGCYQATSQGQANCNTHCQSVAGRNCVRIEQVGVCDFAPAYSCCYREVIPTATPTAAPLPTATPTLVPGTKNCHERCDLAGSPPTYGQCKTGLSCGQVPGSTRIGMCLNLACPDKEDCVCACQTCPTTAPAKARGNANCDGRIDLVDFGIWVNEFRRARLSKDADFNCDNKVDIVDFAIWRQNRR